MAPINTFRIDVGAGLLAGAVQIPSPNQDARPPGAAIGLIVVHGISLPPGAYGDDWVEALFTNQLPPDRHPFFRTIAGLRVSAHLYIRRNGRVVQFVPFHARAWHAGASVWDYRLACNDYSVGIELEGCDHEAYADIQYVHLARIIDALGVAYPGVRSAPIVGHSDIAPGRKTDPGPHFEWDRLRALCRDALDRRI
jgi:N-acetyl-anhydromuramoyl-L-alanine amidase